jgi:hypothetical protein
LKHIEYIGAKMALGLILSVFGLGSLWLLLLRASTYAVPIFVGLTAGWYAFQAGAGPVGSLCLGAVACGAFLAASQAAFSLSCSLLFRGVIAFMFAGPAAYVGYHLVLAVAQYAVPSDMWRHAFAIAGAGIFGVAALARLTEFRSVRG